MTPRRFTDAELDDIKARKLNLPMFRFYPVLKLTVSGNHRPKVGGTDEGIWSRAGVRMGHRGALDRIRACIGVSRLLLQGETPVIVPDVVIREIQGAEFREYVKAHIAFGRGKKRQRSDDLVMQGYFERIGDLPARNG